jgi:hypothetical protein
MWTMFRLFYIGTYSWNVYTWNWLLLSIFVWMSCSQQFTIGLGEENVYSSKWKHAT